MHGDQRSGRLSIENAIPNHRRLPLDELSATFSLHIFAEQKNNKKLLDIGKRKQLTEQQNLNRIKTLKSFDFRNATNPKAMIF